MCPCKKKRIIKYLEGFFDYAGSSLQYEDVYSFLLTSLYQLDDDGNKVLVKSDNKSGKFIIDIDKPVCVGGLFDNTSNLYNDIVKYGFKPIDNYDAKESENSVIIDAVEDSVLPISCNEDTGVCTFSNNVRLLSLPRVNFYIYKQYDSKHNVLPQFSGKFGIKRNGYEMIGYYNYPLEYEDTNAIDAYGNRIQRAKASVLMLPINNADNSKFKLLGHSDGNYGSDYDVEIEEYSFDSSVNYDEEVNTTGTHGLIHVNFVNEAGGVFSRLVPTDSCQFIGSVSYESNLVGFGNTWGAECNDIYCNLSGSLHFNYSTKPYYGNFKKYISSAITKGLYNTRFINKDKSMYLFNMESYKDIIISDNITLGVKALPMLDLRGKISKSDFDSSKPYIYIVRDSDKTNNGLILCNYDDIDLNLVLHITDSFNEPGKYRELTMEASFTIFCSSTAPNDKYQCIRNDASVDIYKLVCDPAKMNGQVRYTLTKI